MQEPGSRFTRWTPREDSSRSTDRLALGSALVGGLLVIVVIAARLVFSGGGTRVDPAVLGIQATGQPGRVQAGIPTQPVTGATSAAASPTALPGNGYDTAHVANTEGQGVVLRASPQENDRTPRGFMDGATVTVLERSGADWARVRGNNGQEGWIPTRYLGP